jgi:type III pantothenate kinase
VKRFLLINAGNSNTQFAVAAEGLIETVWHLPTTAVLAWDNVPEDLLDVCSFLPVLAASVVPRVSEQLRRQLGSRVRFIEAAMIRTVDFSQVEVSTVGADRLANAVAAVDLVAPPVIVLDCGTAITTEVIDADGRFLGGAILPGRGMQRTALNLLTGQLPAVPMTNVRPSAAGGNTQAAIRAGIDLGLIGAIHIILEESRRQAGSDGCPILLAGGDAAYFEQHIRGVRMAPENFTLRGLARVAMTLSGIE